MSEAVLVGIGSLLTVVIGALVAGAVTLMKARTNSQRANQKVSLGERKTAIEEWEKFSARQTDQIVQQQKDINLLRDEHSECEVAIASLYGTLLLYHDIMGRMARALQRLGEDVGDLPVMPPRPTRRHAIDPGFVARTSEQATLLSQAVSAKLQQGPTAGGQP